MGFGLHEVFDQFLSGIQILSLGITLIGQEIEKQGQVVVKSFVLNDDPFVSFIGKIVGVHGTSYSMSDL